MNILVTGATGFIGNHIVTWLANNSRLNNTIIATSTNIEKARKYEWFDKITFIPCDYYQENLDFFNYFQEPDLLIHTAWKNVHDVENKSHLIENYSAELRFISNFLQHKKTKIVVTGTCYEYGVVNGCLNEMQKTNPTTPYSIAKDKLRQELEFTANKCHIPWNWIRLFFIYGDGQNSQSLLPQLYSAIKRGDTEFLISGNKLVRDYLPVEIVADYVCKIALSDTNGIVNCCSGRPITLQEFLEEKITESNSSIKLKSGCYPPRKYEGMEFWGDITKLQQILKKWT